MQPKHGIPNFILTRSVKNIILLFLPIQIIVIKWIANYPKWVETYYSEGLYPYIANFNRILSGWFPISIGDILYGTLLVTALRYLYRNRKNILKRPLQFLKDIGVVLSVVYFLFHILWGINYYRLPIEEKLAINSEYSKQDLLNFTHYLIEQCNRYQQEITGDSLQAVVLPYSKKEVFKKTELGYAKLQKKFPFLEYRHSSLKKSIYSLPLTYMGFGGYLNPFTNEAQINSVTPAIRFPSVSGHEVGHQLGYSAEDDTNLIGLIVTAQNEDPYFKYAAYFHAIAYGLGAIRNIDSTTHKKLVSQLNPGVRANFQELIDHQEQYKNPLEPIFKAIFDTFLKANAQDKGIQSYSAVLGPLINYWNTHNF